METEEFITKRTAYRTFDINLPDGVRLNFKDSFYTDNSGQVQFLQLGKDVNFNSEVIPTNVFYNFSSRTIGNLKIDLTDISLGDIYRKYNNKIEKGDILTTSYTVSWPSQWDRSIKANHEYIYGTPGNIIASSLFHGVNGKFCDFSGDYICPDVISPNDEVSLLLMYGMEFEFKVTLPGSKSY